MCRIGIFHGMDSVYETAWALAELELSQGGHGNGYYDVEAEKLKRGTKLSVTDIARDTYAAKGMVIFHTRLASAGGIKDHLCHPFEVEGEAGKFVVVHNGHWSSWRRYAHKDEESDTQTIANLVGRYGLGVLLSQELNMGGVYVVCEVESGRVFITRRSGTFVFQTFKARKECETPFFHASEKLATLAYDLKDHWTPGYDKLWEVMLDGTVAEIRGVEKVSPAPAPYKSYASSSSYKGSWSGGWSGDGWGCSGDGCEDDYSTYQKNGSSNGYSGSGSGYVYRGDERTWAWHEGTMSLWECYCTLDWTCRRCLKFETKDIMHEVTYLTESDKEVLVREMAKKLSANEAETAMVLGLPDAPREGSTAALPDATGDSDSTDFLDPIPDEFRDDPATIFAHHTADMDDAEFALWLDEGCRRCNDVKCDRALSPYYYDEGAKFCYEHRSRTSLHSMTDAEVAQETQ